MNLNRFRNEKENNVYLIKKYIKKNNSVRVLNGN